MLLKHQVGNFEVVISDPLVASIVLDLDKIDKYLSFPLKRMGFVTLFNRIDIVQTRDYIKNSVETCIERVCEKHMMAWMGKSNVVPLAYLPNRKKFIIGFLSAVWIMWKYNVRWKRK